MPANSKNPERWNGENKLAVIIETAALNAEELSQYCRRKGLHVEQIERWRASAIAGAQSDQGLTAGERDELLKDRKKARALEKQLRRKDKALAEAAALLILQKKVQALWADDADD